MSNFYRIGVLCLLVGIVQSFYVYNKPTKYHFPQLRYFPPMPTAEKYEVTDEGVALGRYLFYDKILSRDSTLSCASCHRLEVAFSDSPKRFSTGVSRQEQMRNTPALYNLAWYDGFFWDGKAATLEDQILFPVRDHREMNLDWKTATKRILQSDFYKQKFHDVYNTTDIDSTLITYSIAQFERTLISNNSKYDKVLRREAFLTPEEYQGFVLMNDQVKGNCMHCHTTDSNALGTTGKYSNNGLDPITNPQDYIDPGRGAITKNRKDNGKFKIPSLRNIALTPPYMHDGRFKTLEEVINFYSEGFHNSSNIDGKMMYSNKKNRRLSSAEKKSIIAFLNTLTDTTFITNKAFKNPFTKDE